MYKELPLTVPYDRIAIKGSSPGVMFPGKEPFENCAKKRENSIQKCREKSIDECRNI